MCIFILTGIMYVCIYVWKEQRNLRVCGETALYSMLHWEGRSPNTECGGVYNMLCKNKTIREYLGDPSVLPGDCGHPAQR